MSESGAQLFTQLMAPSFPVWNGQAGVWGLYEMNNDSAWVIVMISREPATLVQKSESYQQVGFFPLGMEIDDAVEWFKAGDDLYKEPGT